MDANSILSDWKLVSGLLGGSLATSLIRWIADQITSRQIHRRELNKVLYVKKLDVAEKSIAFFRGYAGRVSQLKAAFNATVKTAMRGSPSMIEVMDAIRPQLIAIGELEKVNFDSHRNTCYLYFDLGEELSKWTDGDLQRIYELVGEMTDISKSETPNLNEFIKILETLVKNMEKHVETMNAISEKIKTQVKKL